MTFSEATALRARQGMAGLWLAIIASLFHDPITPEWTGTDSPFRPLAEEATRCVQVQDHCLHSSNYPLGAPLHWGLLLPVLIAVIFLFGHELWRRVCPLSFFSQLGRRFGRGGKIRSDSFLARHHFEIQFGLFYLALCCRILFVNADRLCLAVFLLAFILAAFVVGMLFEGKSWCQYFCPVAPVEEFYTGPRGLLGSQAHGPRHRRARVSQSMCRTLPAKGLEEKSACVGCKLHCIDIDAEKTYWQGLMQPRRQRLSYGYAGLVISYFGYYYLYAGNWWY
ncbi:MAG TPA: 4Fe-4S binding protein, partial [Cyanobium sp.]|nr:4Fe-4S binding protein [Cyanobium sp.]